MKPAKSLRIIAALCAVMMILSLCLTACVNRKTLDYSAITGGRDAEAAYATVNSERAELENLPAAFRPNQTGAIITYTEYKGDTGDTAHRTFSFYDAADQLLYQIVDIGNRGIISVIIDGSEYTYSFTETIPTNKS